MGAPSPTRTPPPIPVYITCTHLGQTVDSHSDMYTQRRLCLYERSENILFALLLRIVEFHII